MIIEPLEEDELRLSLEQAEAGDTYEGKRVIYSLYFLLSPFSKPRNQKKSTPLPDFVNEYLMKFFMKILRGVDANQALNLTRPGRPQRLGHIEKRRAATLVYQLINGNDLTVEQACEAAEQKIAMLRQNVITANTQLEKLKKNELINNQKLFELMEKHELCDHDIWGKNTNIPAVIKQQIDDLKNSLSKDNYSAIEIYRNTHFEP